LLTPAQYGAATGSIIADPNDEHALMPLTERR
jgi:hypothetical protein